MKWSIRFYRIQEFSFVRILKYLIKVLSFLFYKLIKHKYKEFNPLNYVFTILIFLDHGASKFFFSFLILMVLTKTIPIF
jgi:hypothetical protein